VSLFIQEDTGRCILLTRMRPVRPSGPLGRQPTLPGLPPQSRATRRPAALPSPWQAGLSAGRHRLVWVVLPPRPNQAAAPDLPRVRPAASACRLGLCSACWQRHPGRPFIRGEHLRDHLANPPAWLEDFVAHVAARFCVARACGLVTDLGRLLNDEHPNSPQALLKRSRKPGRSMGSFACAGGLLHPPRPGPAH
jgi:hypothetical protein